MYLLLFLWTFVIFPNPTDPFLTAELQNPLHGVPELHWRSWWYPDFEVQKLWKGRSGFFRCAVKGQKSVFFGGNRKMDRYFKGVIPSEMKMAVIPLLFPMVCLWINQQQQSTSNLPDRPFAQYQGLSGQHAVYLSPDLEDLELWKRRSCTYAHLGLFSFFLSFSVSERSFLKKKNAANKFIEFFFIAAASIFVAHALNDSCFVTIFVR